MWSSGACWKSKMRAIRARGCRGNVCTSVWAWPKSYLSKVPRLEPGRCVDSIFHALIVDCFHNSYNIHVQNFVLSIVAELVRVGILLLDNQVVMRERSSTTRTANSAPQGIGNMPSYLGQLSYLSSKDCNVKWVHKYTNRVYFGSWNTPREDERRCNFFLLYTFCVSFSTGTS